MDTNRSFFVIQAEQLIYNLFLFESPFKIFEEQKYFLHLSFITKMVINYRTLNYCFKCLQITVKTHLLDLFLLAVTTVMNIQTQI